MPPGDSRIGLHTGGLDTEEEAVNEDDRPPWQRGGPMREASGWKSHVVDMDSAEEEVLLAEVRYWKGLADELKLAGFPLYPSMHDEDSFGEEMLAKWRHLDDFVDSLLCEGDEAADGDIAVQSVVDRLRVLVAQGHTLEKFKQTMRDLDFTLKCNVIWENDAVAYRCSTCALTPCMSLCAACFLDGDHEGHDFTRFFSREGGACDCGCDDVLKPSGFCKRHGADAPRPPPSSPLAVSLAEFVAAKLIVRVFLKMRGWNQRVSAAAAEAAVAGNAPVPPDEVAIGEKSVQAAGVLVKFVQELIGYGGPLRDAIATLLLDEALYAALTQRKAEDVMRRPASERRADTALDWRTSHLLAEDMESMADWEVMRRDFPECDVHVLRCTSLLDELLFWIVRLVFPQQLINLSLSMLSDQAYRDAFSLRFFRLYPFVAEMMRRVCAHSQRQSVSNIGSRIIHVAVQMLSSASLCFRLQSELDLVAVVLRSVAYLLSERIVDKPLGAGSWRVIDCETNPVLAQHGYWFVMGDMQNLLSHPGLAVLTLKQEATLRHYLKNISWMQGMNSNQRIVAGNHREHDTAEPFQRSFTLEYETAAISMFNMIVSVRHEKDAGAATAFLRAVEGEMRRWLACFPDASVRPPNGEVSFHIPLHRHLSTALTHFATLDEFAEEGARVWGDEDMMRRAIMAPMRIQVTRAEYFAGMWVRNGQQMRAQAILYAQQHLNTAFLVPDVDLIRLCAANVPADWLLEQLYSEFHLRDVFLWEGERDEERLGGRPEEQEEEEVQIVEEEGVRRALHPAPFNIDGIDDEEVNVEMEQADGAGGVEEEEEEEQMEQREQEEERAASADLLRQIARRMEQQQSIASEGGEAGEGEGTEMEAAEAAEPVPVTVKIVEGTRVRWDERAAWGPTTLTRLPWIDHLVFAAFKLIAEIVVVRENAGATEREQLRDELVNALALQDLPHSRLRSIPSEKGSRASEQTEQMFEEIVNEIADFREPDSEGGQGLRQGVYRLRDDAWRSLFCPVYCHLRAMAPKHCTIVFAEAERRDQAEYAAANGIPATAANAQKEHMWIPYRLVDFCSVERYPSVSSIAGVLVCKRFIELAVLVLKTFRFHASAGYLRETTLEMVVYLLSLSVSYAATLTGKEREAALSLFTRKWHVRERVESETGEVVEEEREVESECCVADLLVGVFLSHAGGMESKAAAARLRSELSKPVQARIVGGMTEYMGRLLAILYNTDPTSAAVVDGLLKPLEVVAPEGEGNGEEQSAAAASERKRQAAKRRREAVMAMNQKRQADVMRRLMDAEGLSQSDLDAIDTSQPDVKLYECPICADSGPSTLQQPMGLLVRAVRNVVCEQALPAGEPDSDLVQLDERRRDNQGAEPEGRKSVRLWAHAKTEIGGVTLMAHQHGRFDAPVGYELRTCGHTAHIECFNAYRDTLHLSELRILPEGSPRGDVSCPLCRFSVNTQLPLAVDCGFETTSRRSVEHEDAEVEKAYVEAIARWPSAFEFQRDNPEFDRADAHRQHYNVPISDMMQMHGIYVEGQADSPRGQTYVVGLVKGNVERNLHLEELGVVERRKNTRGIVTEHLLACVVAKTSRTDAEVATAALRDLFDGEPMETVPTVAGFARFLGHSGGEEMMVDYPSTSENDLPNMDEWMEPQTVEERVQDARVMDTTHDDEEEERPAAAGDEQEEMEEGGGEGGVGPREERRRRRDTGRPLTPISERTSFSTSTTTQHVEPFDEEELRILLGDSEYGEPRWRRRQRHMRHVSARVPLLLYDMRTLCIRLSAYVVVNNTLSHENKLQLLRALTRKLTGALLVRTAVQLALRHPADEWRRELDRREPGGVSELLVHVLEAMEQSHSIDYVKQMLPDEKEAGWVDDVRGVLLDWLRFIAQFWHEAKMKERVDGCMTDEDSLVRHVFDGSAWLPPSHVAARWVAQFMPTVAANAKTAHKALWQEPLRWRAFSLLALPNDYDAVFSRFFSRVCVACGRQPQHPLVCMVCAQMSCLDDCCRTRNPNGVPVTEVDRHVVECGGGSSGCFLAVNSAVVVMIRGKTAAIWGSIHLDKHGEEDRNLRRGKPLYLSNKRLDALRRDWLEQDFSSSPLSWFPSVNLISYIRDAHHHYR